MDINYKKVEVLRHKVNLTRNENIFYQGNRDLRKKGVNYIYSHSEMIEFSKCFNSKEYFLTIYLDIKILDFHLELIKRYENNRSNIFVLSREIGFNKILAALYLWEIIFNTNQMILYVDNKSTLLTEMINNIKKHYIKIPFFLKPGILSWRKQVLSFDNNNRITTLYPNQTFSIGYQINILHINNMSNIQNKYITEFYSSIIPVISAIVNSKIILSSPFNGKDFFYKLYKNSILSKNDPTKNSYESIKFDYNVIPGRGKDWVSNRKNKFGDLVFDQNYRCKNNSKRKQKVYRILKIITE